MDQAVDKIRNMPLGSRLVVRYRIDGGLTDALGDLVSLEETSCTVRTRGGDVVVPFTQVQLAKEVPPAPVPRSRRF